MVKRMRKALWAATTLLTLLLAGCGGGSSDNPFVTDTVTALYGISGTVTVDGARLAGVTISIPGRSTTTDSNGIYHISGMANGTYVVTPAKSGYIFTPASATITIADANVTGLNFAAATTLPVDSTVASTFDASAEGWLVAGDAQGASATPLYFAAGGNPGGFVEATDNATGGTWYWMAPGKFLGDNSTSYGKILEFDLTQSELDSQFDDIDLILVGGGITLTYEGLVHPGTGWTHYSVVLSETGWKRGDAAATGADFQTVLAAVTSLAIRGEYRAGEDSGMLDNVILHK